MARRSCLQCDLLKIKCTVDDYSRDCQQCRARGLECGVNSAKRIIRGLPRRPAVCHPDILHRLSPEYEPTTLQSGPSGVPSVIPSSVKRGQIDLEPDDAGKDTLEKRIEELKSMIDDAIRALVNQLASIPPNNPRQEGTWEDYDKGTKNIVNLTNELSQVVLEYERQESRWWNGQTIRDGADTEAEIIEQDASRMEPADLAWTLNPTALERGKQGPPSRSVNQSIVTDRQHDKSSSYSSPSSGGGGGQRSGVRPLPSLPNASNSMASVLSLQERDQAAHPPPAWPMSKASFNDYPVTACHPSVRLSYQPEQRRVTTWPGTMQLPISPPQRQPSENRPTFLKGSSFVNHPSYAAPEGLPIPF